MKTPSPIASGDYSASRLAAEEEENEFERLLLQLLDEEYMRHPFYGSRRMTK